MLSATPVSVVPARPAVGIAHPEAGVTLIESLIALVVFAVAVLGLVSLNASTNRVAQDARYRTEAALLADELIARMQASDRATVAAQFATGGPQYSTWLTRRVRAARTGLPGGGATVDFAAVGAEPLSVRIAITWTPPRETARDATGVASAVSQVRRHVTVTALYD